MVSYVRRFDDGPPWDFPAQRAAAGVPAVLVEQQEYGRVTDVERILRELRPAVAA